MKVLLDTCVISESCKPQGGDARVVAALREVLGGDAFLSVVTIGEMARGIAQLDEGKRKRELAAWMSALEHDLSARVLHIDVETARTWGGITAARQRFGRPLAAADGLIAATAVRHGMAVMTRNVRDFEGTGAELVNPWVD